MTALLEMRDGCAADSAYCVLAYAIVYGRQRWYRTIELSQSEVNLMGLRDALFSGQDGLSLSSVWEGHP